MNAQQYVSRKIKTTNNSKLAGFEARIFGSLAVASITRTTVVTADVESAIDSLFRKLSAKLKSNMAVPGSNTKTVSEADMKAGNEAKESKAINEANLRKLIDPQTGDQLNVVKLLGGVDALHNPRSRVVYPIPGTGKTRIPETV